MWHGHHCRLQKRLSNWYRPTSRCPRYWRCLSHIRSWHKCWPPWRCITTSCIGPTIIVTCPRQWRHHADTLRLLTPQNCPRNSLAGATSAQRNSMHRIWQQTYSIFHCFEFRHTFVIKNLTDDSTVATLVFSRVAAHHSTFRDLMSHAIAWFKLLNLASKSLNGSTCPQFG